MSGPDYFYRFESEAAQVVSLEAKYMVSTAISLKRIADALDKVTAMDAVAFGEFVKTVIDVADPDDVQ